MADIIVQAKASVETLLQSDEDQLYAQLGMRAKAIASDAALAGSFEPKIPTTRGLKEDFVAFGKRLFQRWNVEAHNLICGSDEDSTEDREELQNAFHIGPTEVAAALAGMMVAHLGLAPAIAAVVASLVIKRFFRPAYVEFCQTWQNSLAKNE